jgi:hypothetical protein
MPKPKKPTQRQAAAAIIRLYEYYGETLDLEATADDTALGVLWAAILDGRISVPGKKGRPPGSRNKNPIEVAPGSDADRQRKTRTRKHNADVVAFFEARRDKN